MWDDDAELDPEMTAAIARAHAKNPVDRKPGPLVHYIENCAKIAPVALFGLINAVQPGPTLALCHATLLHQAIAKYCARLAAAAVAIPAAAAAVASPNTITPWVTVHQNTMFVIGLATWTS